MRGAAWGTACGLVVLLAACTPKLAKHAGEAPPAEVRLPSAAEFWPISTEFYRTTSADIYLGSLDARIGSLERRQEAGYRDQVETLASLRYHRFKVLGRLDDAERALELLEARAERDALGADGMLVLATALAGMHRFDEALAWTERAAAAGADPERLRELRADLDVALGRYDALAADFEASEQPIGDFYASAHRADLRVLQGDLAGAERQYLAAQTLYRDTNPVPLAWLHTQMGIAQLRFGRFEEARRFFAGAVARLPGYYLAEEHLAECEAELGELEAARARYQRVIEQTGNPQFLAALADLEERAGNADRTAQLREVAEAEYERMLGRHPQAFAQHAAEFFLAIGEPGRAFELAQANARQRADIGSRILLATAAAAAGETAMACAARSDALATGLNPPELAELAPLKATCDRKKAEVDGTN